MRRFLQNVKDTQRPIYLHSPGGVVEQAFLIGRLLRGRKAVARVGRTIVTACRTGSQTDEGCLKLKAAGGELRAELETRRAMCNSACAYLFLGATAREVAPDAVVGVHSSKLTITFRGHPTADQVAMFRARSIARADRERASFVAGMGISRELTDLISTVKFENVHVLTRSELFRFGIDTRPLAETAWTFETAARPYVRKLALAKRPEDASFQTVEWRLFCDGRDRARMVFIREYAKAAAEMKSVVLTADAGKPAAFGTAPAHIGNYLAWSRSVGSDDMKAMLSVSSLHMEGTTLSPDGKAGQEKFDIDTRGLDSAWTGLLASCAVTPDKVRPAAAGEPAYRALRDKTDAPD